MMTFLARRAVLSGLALAGPAAAQPARPRVGEVTAVRGSAYVRYSAGAPRSLAVPDPLWLNDLVTTGLGSRLTCQLAGGIGLNLGERASLLLDRHLIASRDPGTVLRLSGGAVLLQSAEGRATPIALVTPWARIRPLGRAAWGGPLDSGFAVFAPDGEVEVDAGSRRVRLVTGEGVDIRAPGEEPEGLRPWDQERIARAVATVL